MYCGVFKMKIHKQDLLIHGIVDGLLDDGEFTWKLKRNRNKFNIFTLHHLGYNEKLYTSKNINEPPSSIYELGCILGYPPECARMWGMYLPFLRIGLYTDLFNTTINYNSICFNTMGLTDYAIKWCMDNYEKKVLEVFGKSTLNVKTVTKK